MILLRILSALCGPWYGPAEASALTVYLRNACGMPVQTGKGSLCSSHVASLPPNSATGLAKGQGFEGHSGEVGHPWLCSVQKPRALGSGHHFNPEAGGVFFGSSFREHYVKL